MIEITYNGFIKDNILYKGYFCNTPRSYWTEDNKDEFTKYMKNYKIDMIPIFTFSSLNPFGNEDIDFSELGKLFIFNNVYKPIIVLDYENKEIISKFEKLRRIQLEKKKIEMEFAEE